VGTTGCGMPSMLRISEIYANEFDVIFNASKSKRVICPGRGAVHRSSSPTLPSSICGNVIEIVNAWPHLGHIICKDNNDRLDILNRQHCFINQANNIVCWRDCITKTRLLKA